MAKITLDLNQFKASGVYTVEFDASERIVLTTETIRMVIGFSRIGPFNAPVFLRDLKTARKVFGNIDTFLEKRGSYFHRAIETCLQTGPVFALNLLPLNNIPLSQGGDAVQYRSFALAANEQNGEISRDLLASWYNKERFWFPESENFVAIANNNALNKGKLFNLVNLSKTPMSFIIRKPNPKVQGYALTAREWYGAGNSPEFIREFDYLEDYFIEIIAVEGNWTNYNRLSEDPIYSKYFDKRGVKVDKLNDFLAMEETTVVANFVGTIIPDFIDRNGSNQFIEVLVNNSVATTGIFCSVNREALDDYANSINKVDLVGHSLVNTNDSVIDFLSYNTPISKKIAFEVLNHTEFVETEYTIANAKVISQPLGGNSGNFENVLIIPKPNLSDTVFTLANYQYILDNLSNISLIKTKGSTPGSDYVKVDTIVDNGNELRIVLSNPEKPAKEITTTVSSPGVLGSQQITLDDKTLVSGDIIYVSAPGFKAYYEIDTANAGVYKIKTENTLSYVEKDLDPLVNAIDNNTFAINDIVVKGWVILDNEFIIDLTADVTVVYTPDITSQHKNGSENDYIESYPGSVLSKEILNSRLVDGDLIYGSANTFNYVNVDESWPMNYGLVGTRVRQYSDSSLTTQVVGANFVTLGASYEESSSYSGDLLFYSASIGNLRKNIEFVSINGSFNKFAIAEVDSSKIEVGYFIVTQDNTLTRVTNKVKKFNTLTGDVTYEIETTEKVAVINDNEVTVFTPINTFADRLNFTHLSGFNLTEFHLPGTPAQLWKILGVLENTNIGLTLASRDIIQFRYIIDTFKFGIEPQMGAKVILSNLARKRQKCMAILNAPSIKEFIESTDPRFTDEPDPMGGNPKPLLNTEYIATGGNLTLGPSYRFSLPDEENGAKFIGVFSPFLTYRENNKNIQVPPAADVSNNFIRKFLNGQPYSIVAGPRRGVISNPKVVGLEHEYTLQDREFLEPFGINPIVTVRNIGIMIYGNQSAYQKTLSAYNNLHVRDLLITVEAAVEDVLAQYLFEFNDAATRLEIKSIVENFLEKIRNAGGIFDYMVIMDETNNTSETIDANFGIIDIGIEPARGMQKFVNRVTILKTGAIASGGFTIA